MHNKGEIPFLGMMQIGEAAVDQRADEVEGERAALVAAQQQHRIGRARFAREIRAIHIVAAKARQLDAIAHFVCGAPRLGILACKAADSGDALAGAVHKHEAHLQQDLELGGDGGRIAISEILRTIAAPEDEAFAARRLGKLQLQRLDFITGDQRWQRCKLGKRALEHRRVGIDGLLHTRERLPALRRPHGVRE